MTRSLHKLASIKLWEKYLSSHKAIAIIRSPQLEIGLAMAHAVAAGGIKLIEITWNSDSPEKLISLLRIQLPHCSIGAGTILNEFQLQTAVAAGAQFAFSPHFDRNLLKMSLDRYHIPLVPGVLSPTEIITAWQAGANIVKVFPIGVIGGENYIKSLQGPLNCVSLIPTGGVTVDNAKRMLNAGAIAVGLSGNLFLTSLIAEQNWEGLTKRAQLLVEVIHST